MKVNEIFTSISGEVGTRITQGMPTIFLRLQGCNLRCSYCDTNYSQEFAKGKDMAVQEVAEEILKVGCPNLVITGGEPLLQYEAVQNLVKDLILMREDMTISVETNGSFTVPVPIGLLTDIIMDYKLPSSEMEHKMTLLSFMRLSQKDWIKFVIFDEVDFEYALNIKETLGRMGCKARFAFSPCWSNMGANTLAKLLVENGLWDAVLNLQLHKVARMK